MFWKHFAPPISDIDILLDKDGCTLKEILETEDVLQECKGINSKLLKFFTQDENIAELVSLVSTEPSTDVDETERYKLPNTACNVLTSGAVSLVERICDDESLLDRLFQFLDGESPVNCLLASFFSRVVVELCTTRSTAMLQYMAVTGGHLDRLLYHIDTSAIVDLILGVVSTFQSTDERLELCKWISEHKIIDKLVDMIRGGVCEEKQRSAARTLVELHRYGYEFLSLNYDTVPQDDVVDVLESKETITKLLENALTDRSATTPLYHVMELLNSMATMQQAGTPNGGMQAEPMQNTNITNETATRHMAQYTTPFLPRLLQALAEPPAAQPMRTSAGEIPVPLGAARLSIIKLLTNLLQVGCPELDAEMTKLKFPVVILDLFFLYRWNSFLHSQVDQYVGYALSLSPSIGSTLHSVLLVDAKLLQRLAAAAMANERDQEAKLCRHGYMGHVVNISNSTLQALENIRELQALVEDINTDDLDEWRAWVDGPLETVNSKNNTILGGSVPVTSLMEDSDEEVRVDTSRQQPSNAGDLFSFYETQHMASDFADNFGFDDEDFNDFEESENASFNAAGGIDFSSSADQASSSTLFEQACSERCQRYSSDEDEEDSFCSRMAAMMISSHSSGEGEAVVSSTKLSMSSARLSDSGDSVREKESDHDSSDRDSDDDDDSSDGATGSYSFGRNDSSSSEDDTERSKPDDASVLESAISSAVDVSVTEGDSDWEKESDHSSSNHDSSDRDSDDSSDGGRNDSSSSGSEDETEPTKSDDTSVLESASSTSSAVDISVTESDSGQEKESDHGSSDHDSSDCDSGDSSDGTTGSYSFGRNDSSSGGSEDETEPTNPDNASVLESASSSAVDISVTECC